MITNLNGYFYFQLSFSEEKEVAFQEVTGLSNELETSSFHELPSVLPKKGKYSNLVLKRGVVATDSLLLQWCQDTVASDFSKPISTHTLYLDLMNEQGEKIIHWVFYDAWPVKLNISSIKDDQISVETLEFAYSYFERS